MHDQGFEEASRMHALIEAWMHWLSALLSMQVSHQPQANGTSNLQDHQTNGHQFRGHNGRNSTEHETNAASSSSRSDEEDQPLLDGGKPLTNGGHEDGVSPELEEVASGAMHMGSVLSADLDELPKGELSGNSNRPPEACDPRMSNKYPPIIDF